MFFAAKELWTQGTAEVICLYPTPSSCRKLEPLSCTPAQGYPNSNCILPYCPPASLCQGRTALFAPKFFQKRGTDLTVRIPPAHSVFCPSFLDDPISPQEQRSYHAVLGCPSDPLFFGYLGCHTLDVIQGMTKRHPLPHYCQRQDSHLSLCLQQTHGDTTDLKTCSFELKITS